MSPSTPAKKIKIPYQPNPFASYTFESPWDEDSCDVASINAEPFQLITSALQQLRIGAKGSSLVLIGVPGSGKTHLLGRLLRRLREDARSGRGETIYIYVRCNATASTLWRHLRQAIGSDLLKGTTERSFARLLQSRDVENVGHPCLQSALIHIRDGRNSRAAARWLRGDTLTLSDSAALDLPLDDDVADNDLEREARLVVAALLEFLTPLPVVVCFDQLEALQAYRGDEAGIQALGKMVSDLRFLYKHLLLISCIVSAFEDAFDRIPNEADRDRWLQAKGVLKPVNWQGGTEIIKLRLDNSPALSGLRAKHSDDPLWPIDAEPLKQLFVAELCPARTLIRNCEQQFGQLINESPKANPLKLDAFLEEQLLGEKQKARLTIERQSLAKTLSDCLPWLLEHSQRMTLGHDEARSRYANQAWRGPGGDIALAFCDTRGKALFNQINRIRQSWNPKDCGLLVLRDVTIKPGERSAELLADLKQKGAREVHPLPEALAALQAIRNLRATAGSDELFNGDDLVSEQAVTDWALAHLPPSVEALRDAIIGKPTGPDPVMPKLAELLNEKKVMAAAAAASALNISPEEVKECAGRHPLRFGLLAGPPVVVFDGTRSSQR